MRSIDQLKLNGQTVLIRVDFNVPLDSNLMVTDDTRIRAAIPTIEKVLSEGGKVVLMSHLGRPNGTRQDKYSLFPIAKHLSSILNKEVLFLNDCVGEGIRQKIKDAPNDSVILLENLRFYSQETAGEAEFSKELASNGDIYLNDAFGTAHRAHASTAVIAKSFMPDQKAFGYLMAGEIESLERAIHSGRSPKTAIIGGSKVSSKIDVLARLLEVTDNIIIGGGMAYTFAKALGGRVGKSLVEADKIGVADDFLKSAKERNVSVYLPQDSLNARVFEDQPAQSVSDIMKIPSDEMGLDIGPEAIEEFKGVIERSSTIIWNGPMGVFEFKNYENGTRSIGIAVSRATEGGAFSLVGGGDSVAAVKKFGLEDSVSYISTGGGAMLEYLEGKVLPGVKSILE